MKMKRQFIYPWAAGLGMRQGAATYEGARRYGCPKVFLWVAIARARNAYIHDLRVLLLRYKAHQHHQAQAQKVKNN